MSNLEDTIGNKEWLQQNEHKLRDLFPKAWTHFNNLNILQIGFKLKLIGVDWRSEDDLTNILAYFERLDILYRKDHTVKANPHNIFIGKQS